MMRIKKRAYLATFLILVAVGAAAYYSNEQAKHFEVEVDTDVSVPVRTKVEQQPPTPAPAPSPTPAPVPAPGQPPRVKTVSKIVKVSLYAADPNVIEVEKGNKVNIALDADDHTSGDGLDFIIPQEGALQLAPGQTDTVTFTAESTFHITGYRTGTNEQLPYTIYVIVK